jgi:hypothetical protein
LVRRIRRGYAARGVRPASKTALTRDPLDAMLKMRSPGFYELNGSQQTLI